MKLKRKTLEEELFNNSISKITPLISFLKRFLMDTACIVLPHGYNWVTKTDYYRFPFIESRLEVEIVLRWLKEQKLSYKQKKIYTKLKEEFVQIINFSDAEYNKLMYELSQEESEASSDQDTD